MNIYSSILDQELLFSVVMLVYQRVRGSNPRQTGLYQPMEICFADIPDHSGKLHETVQKLHTLSQESGFEHVCNHM